MNGMHTLDVIGAEEAGTLAGLFHERVRRTPDAIAYRYHDPISARWQTITWEAMARWVAGWQALLAKESLSPGDRVALMARNGPAWVAFDQAALGLGLVVVPLHVEDSPDNLAHTLEDSGARVLLIGGADEWQRVDSIWSRLPALQRVFSLRGVNDPRVVHLAPTTEPARLVPPVGRPDDLATIIYTSGTTGRRPKGVMLSHRNILWNGDSGLRRIAIYREDLFFSFLPLAHAFERTVGYYLPMMAGATVAYARSVAQLAEDMRTIQPTVIISVPRIYEKVHNRIQEQLATRPRFARMLFQQAVETGWGLFEYRQGRRRYPPASAALWPLLDALVARKIRAGLGGRIRIAICGGAPLPYPVARTFLGLGLPLLQGYGMTEASPVLCVNTPESNDPESVGPPLPEVELRLGEGSELLARGPGLMLGYWGQPEATAQAINGEGWLHTGDQARLAEGYVYLTGRLKEIIVLSNGKKIPPDELEMAIRGDPLFEQVMILGDNRPYLSALVVLNPTYAESLLEGNGWSTQPSEQAFLATVLARLSACISGFPGHAKVRRLAVIPEPWSVENGCMTPTLKLRRKQILALHADRIKELYPASEPPQAVPATPASAPLTP